MGKIDKPIRLGRGWALVRCQVALSEPAWNKLLKGVRKECRTAWPAGLHASQTTFEFSDMKPGYGPVSIITLSPEMLKRPTVVILALLAHEAVHFKQANERLMHTTFDVETEAYMVQAVALDIWYKIKRFVRN